ncbi:MAG: hypothetical protein KDC00_00525 [Flavobacteriales bacterium]|nr:hypothetical protein [Flavobacteriales bacterium]
MKTRIALSLLLVGTAMITIGGIFKLLHWPTANIQLLFGTVVQASALLVLAVKVARTHALRTLLDE